MDVVFSCKLICSMNVLCMELSYTGSLDQSTKASEHVMVQIGRLRQLLTIVLSHLVDFFKLNRLLVMYSLYCGCGLFSMNVLYMELSYTGSLEQSTKASEHVINTYMATAGFNNCVVPPCSIFSIKWTVDYVFPFAVGVVLPGSLICSMNVLYMELSYTG